MTVLSPFAVFECHTLFSDGEICVTFKGNASTNILVAPYPRRVFTSSYGGSAALTRYGPETKILVFGVFSLQLTDDANLPFNTRVDFTHLITQYIKQKKKNSGSRAWLLKKT
jgi:hypothetical protein